MPFLATSHVTLLSPALSKQTFIAQHLKLEVIISFILHCEIVLIFKISPFICQEQRLSRKWLSSQNCSIGLCLENCCLNCLRQGRILTKVNCTKAVPVVHSYKCHVFSKINTEADRMAVQLQVQSSVNETAE